MFLKPTIPAYTTNPFNLNTQSIIQNANLNKFMIDLTTQNDFNYALESISLSNQQGYSDAMKQLSDSTKKQ
jgi:hypothetical protein